MKQYLSIAYRYGQKNGYHYPIGIFSTLEIAIENSKNHFGFRGGKYSHRVFEIEPGETYDAEEAKVVWDSM